MTATNVCFKENSVIDKRVILCYIYGKLKNKE